MVSSLGSPCPTTAASGARSSPDGAPPAENAASPGDEAVFEDYLTDAQSQSAARIAAFLGHRDMPTGGGTPSGLNRTSSVDSTDVVAAEEGSESKVASADVDLVGAPTAEFEPGLFMQVRQVIVGEWWSINGEWWAAYSVSEPVVYVLSACVNITSMYYLYFL